MNYTRQEKTRHRGKLHRGLSNIVQMLLNLDTNMGPVNKQGNYTESSKIVQTLEKIHTNWKNLTQMGEKLYRDLSKTAQTLEKLHINMDKTALTWAKLQTNMDKPA